MSADQAAALMELLARGVTACQGRNIDELRRVVIALTGSLDFRYERATRALAAMYDRGLHDAERGRFERARAIFQRLLAVITEAAGARLD